MTSDWSENSTWTDGLPSAMAEMSISCSVQAVSIVSTEMSFCQTWIPLTLISAWSHCPLSTVSQRQKRSLVPTALEQSMTGERR